MPSFDVGQAHIRLIPNSIRADIAQASKAWPSEWPSKIRDTIIKLNALSPGDSGILGPGASVMMTECMESAHSALQAMFPEVTATKFKDTQGRQPVLGGSGSRKLVLTCYREDAPPLSNNSSSSGQRDFAILRRLKVLQMALTELEIQMRRLRHNPSAGCDHMVRGTKAGVVAARSAPPLIPVPHSTTEPLSGTLSRTLAQSHDDITASATRLGQSLSRGLGLGGAAAAAALARVADRVEFKAGVTLEEAEPAAKATFAAEHARSSSPVTSPAVVARSEVESAPKRRRARM